MKRIGIDARLYFQTGVGVYLRNFLHYLEELPTEGIEFYIYVMKSDTSRIEFNKKNFVKREVSYRWHSFNEQIGFLKTLTADRLDLMHFTYFSYPIFYRKKFIATIHDTILLQHKTGKASTRSPLFYELKHYGARLAFLSQMRNAARIITPSQTVKEELIKLFGDGEKIIPIYEGMNYEYTEEKESRPKHEFRDGEFFMYIGNFYPHKNVEALIRAFSQVKTAKKLLLIGPEDFFMKRLGSIIGDLGQSDRIFFYKKPTNGELIYFYRHALALIHPSLSEGFCLPLVEAAHFKLPVIGSDIPVFREVIGHDYTAFNPHDTGDITHKIEEFLASKTHISPVLRPEFSFEAMSKSILELYRTV